MPPRVLFAACATLSFFALLYVLLDNTFLNTTINVPDMSQYRKLQVMTKEDFPVDDPSRRVIVVGDIHGRFHDLQTLLKHLSYDNTVDTLIHVGDIITKGSHHGSLEVLSYLSSNGILGVRGNQDQKVIEFRSWINWITSLDGGNAFLETAELQWKDAKENGEDLEDWNERQRQRASKAHLTQTGDAMDKSMAKWWRRVPEDVLLFNDVYNLANDISDTDFEYLLALPLKIYVPHAHLFLVHAGMLSHDPNYDFDDPSQPLMLGPPTSRIFASMYRNGRLSGFNEAADPLTGWLAKLLFFNRRTLSEEDRQVLASIDDSTLDATRGKQERAILDLALNKDPWVTLNLRGVKAGGVATRSTKKGTPWAEIWNKDMNRCRGFGDSGEIASSDSVSKKKGHVLPCLPVSVVYGHCASRGLDIKRWSIGLDTGCVYGRRLTALVVGGLNNNTKTESHHDGYRVDEVVPFGDASSAHIASVSCKA